MKTVFKDNACKSQEAFFFSPSETCKMQIFSSFNFRKPKYLHRLEHIRRLSVLAITGLVRGHLPCFRWSGKPLVVTFSLPSSSRG